MVRILAAALMALVMGGGAAQAQWYLGTPQAPARAATPAPAAPAQGGCTFRMVQEKMAAATAAFQALERSNPQRAAAVQAQAAQRMASIPEVSGPVPSDNAQVPPAMCNFWDEMLGLARG